MLTWQMQHHIISSLILGISIYPDNSIQSRTYSFASSLEMSNKRLVFIGDVHGCFDELKSLLHLCNFDVNRPNNPMNPILCFVGDLVAKGPFSQKVLSFVRSIPLEKVHCVMGNHEHRILNYALRLGRLSSLNLPTNGFHPLSLTEQSEHRNLAESLSIEDLEFMASMPLYKEFPELSTIMVHAAIDPTEKNLAKQDPMALLLGRVILPDGSISPSNQEGAIPWASRWNGPETIIFGHDARRGLQKESHAIGLDSGCCYGGQLSAFILPEREIIFVNALKQYKPF